MIWYLTGAVFLVGLWGVLRKPNIVKKVMALSIANSGIILLFLYYGSFSGTIAPIEGSGAEHSAMVDPLPQALMLTAIVVGVCIVALALALCDALFQRFNTLDIREIELQAWKIDE